MIQKLLHKAHEAVIILLSLLQTIIAIWLFTHGAIMKGFATLIIGFILYNVAWVILNWWDLADVEDNQKIV